MPPKAKRLGAEQQRLRTTGHTIVRLGPAVLLVFKPRGHVEAVHAHPHRQRLRVASGRLAVRTTRRTATLTPASAALTLAAGCRHSTEAVEDTWLVVNSLPPRTRRR